MPQPWLALVAITLVLYVALKLPAIRRLQRLTALSRSRTLTDTTKRAACAEIVPQYSVIEGASTH